MMWARERWLVIAVVLLSSMMAFQPTATSGVLTQIPLDNFENTNAGMVVYEVHEDYVEIDVSTTSPDLIEIPIYLLPDGARVAKGILRKASMEEEVVMPLAHDALRGVDYFALIVYQDWPQNWDELVIKLYGQDWPQYEEVIIPLDFQDWPQNWLPAEVV
jgi:hypothetical protein